MPAPKIIFEDSYILVVDKPSGLVVNRAATVKKRTLQDWVEEKIKIRGLGLKPDSDFVRRSGIVHRLDKDTSGVMVIAKTAEAFTYLQSQFKQRRVVKKYLALVHGCLEPRRGNIKLPLARNPSNKKKFAVCLGGRSSETNYRVLKRYDKLLHHRLKRTVSLIELQPKTGRTHQIRVHLKHIGHPIVADPIYLGKKRLKQDKELSPRLFLHAQYLS